MSVFIDTSAIIAFMLSDDAYYRQSYNIFSRLLEEKHIIISSNYLFLETLNLLNSRIGLEAVKLLRNNILPVIKIYWVDEQLHNNCMNIQIASNRKKISLVDYTSFEIMRKLDIRQAFTFDRHFKDMGFEMIENYN